MIGQWIARFYGAEPVTKAHLCESEIGECKVIRCGRQLGEVLYNGKRTEIRESDGPRCVVCSRR